LSLDVSKYLNDSPDLQAGTTPALGAPEGLPNPISPAGEEDPGLITDLGRGAANGAIGFGESVANLGGEVLNGGLWLYDQFTDEDQDDGDYYFKKLVLPKLKASETMAGRLLQVAVQFGLGFAVSGGVLGMAGLGAKVAAGGKLAKGAFALGKGAMADLISFQGHEQRLANLIEEFPALSNPVTDYLAADEEDSEIEGRFKNVLEGLGLAAIISPLLVGLKGLKKLRAGKAAGLADEEIAEQLVKEGITSTADEAVSKAHVGADGNAMGTAADMQQYLYGALENPDDVAEALSKANMAKVVDDIVTKAKSGADLDAAISKTDIRADNWNSESAKSIYESLMSRFNERWPELDRVGKTPREKDYLKHIQAIAEVLGLDRKFVRKWFRDARGGSKMLGPMMAAGKVVNQGFLNDLGKSAMKATLSGDAAQLKAFGEQWVDYLKYLEDYFPVRADVARATTAGRAVVGPSAEAVAETAEVAEQMLKSGEVEKLAGLMAASHGDVGKSMALLRLANQRLTGKIVAVHDEWWYNALLSGLRTHEVNFASNLLNTLVRPAEIALGGFLTGSREARQMGARLYGGLARQAFDFVDTANMSLKVPEALSATGRAFKAGKSLLDPGNIKSEVVGQAISGATWGKTKGPLKWALDGLGAVVNFPSRMLGTSDELFKQLNHRSMVYADTMAEAVEKGLDKEATAELIARKFRESVDDITGASTNPKALEYARDVTYTNDLEYGLGKGLQELIHRRAPVLRYAIPFVRTPVNIARYVWQRLPGLQYLQKGFMDDLKSGNPMRVASARGKQGMGLMYTMAVATLAAEGKITGRGPGNREMRAMKKDTGWQPYSLVLDGEDGKKQHISFNRLDPFGMFLGLVADIAELSGGAEDHDIEEVTAALGVAISQNLTSKTYLSGLSEIIMAIQSPDTRMSDWAARRIGSYIPASVRDMRQGFTDDALRETRGMVDEVMNRIPGLSDKLAPRRNMYGEPISSTQGFRWNAINPMSYSEQLPDEVKDELIGLGHGFAPARPEMGGVDMREYKSKKGQDAYDRFQQLHGEVTVRGRKLKEFLGEVIGSDKYKALPQFAEGDYSSPRVDMIQKVLRRFRSRAYRKVLKEYPEYHKALQAEKQRRSLVERFGPEALNQ